MDTHLIPDTQQLAERRNVPAAGQWRGARQEAALDRGVDSLVVESALRAGQPTAAFYKPCETAEARNEGIQPTSGSRQTNFTATCGESQRTTQHSTQRKEVVMITIALTTIAKLYLSYCLCALPASKETKRPTVAWKSYQDALPTESQREPLPASCKRLPAPITRFHPRQRTLRGT